MKLLTSISLQTEPHLEKWARLFRFGKLLPILKEELAKQKKKKLTLIDYGCGQDTLLYNYLRVQLPELAKNIEYIGVDPLVTRHKQENMRRVKIYAKKFEAFTARQPANVITMFAVLEHVDDPLLLLRTALRSLRSGGVLVVTTPSPLAKLPLEIFAYVFGIISKREIDEHKRYPTRKSLLTYVEQLQAENVQVCATHSYFELGLNNLLVIRKK